MWWSWILAAVGLVGLYLIGRKDWRGFLVGVFAQSLWVAYAIVTNQLGFIVSAIAYGSVYVLGLFNWLKDRDNRVDVPFDDWRCVCGHLASEHGNGGWAQCMKCPCTDYTPNRT